MANKTGSETRSPEFGSDPFDNNRRLLVVTLTVVFILALFMRLRDIQAPGILVEREYTSALFARDFFFDRHREIQPWKIEVVEVTTARQPVLEPPLNEFLVSIEYDLIGREDFNAARFLSAGFWIIGGFFLYLTARVILSTAGAVIALGYYLFVPSGILVSRSFQPDALMMMLFLASLYLIVIYFKKPTHRGLVTAALVTGVTLLLRPLVLFALLSAFTFLSINQHRSLKALLQRPFLVFLGLSLVLPVSYYGYEILFSGEMSWKIDSSFRPYLLWQFEFWRQWFLVAGNEIGFSSMVIALPGFYLLTNRTAKVLLAGLGLGYFIFGLLFTFHIHTHGYYSIQLIPMIALAIAPVFLVVINAVRATVQKFWWLPVGVSLLLVLLFSYRQVREGLYVQVFEAPSTAREIGEVIHHSQNTVFIAYHYGLPLQYYGELSGLPWPKKISDPFYRKPGERELSVEERLKNLGYVPEYFVVTNFQEYRRHHEDLHAYLKSRCTEQIQTEEYLIFSKCQLLDQGL